MTHVHFFISYTVTLTWAVRMCAYIVSLFSIVLFNVVIEYAVRPKSRAHDDTG